MNTFPAVVERASETALLVKSFPGAHLQAETLDELHDDRREVLETLLKDGEPALDTKFVGTQLVSIAA